MNRVAKFGALASLVLFMCGCHQYETVRIRVLEGESHAAVAGAELRTEYREFADFRGVAARDVAITDENGLAEVRVDVTKASLVLMITRPPTVGEAYFGAINGAEMRDWILRERDSTTPIEPLIAYINRPDRAAED